MLEPGLQWRVEEIFCLKEERKGRRGERGERGEEERKERRELKEGQNGEDDILVLELTASDDLVLMPCVRSWE